MSYLDILHDIRRFSEEHPLVHEFDDGDIYEKLNSGEHKYPCVVYTPSTVTVNNDYTLQISGTLFYVDREMDDQKNKNEIQSAGITTLLQITNKIIEEDMGGMISNRTFTPFEQKFADMCAGVFCEMSFEVPNGIICGDSQY